MEMSQVITESKIWHPSSCRSLRAAGPEARASGALWLVCPWEQTFIDGCLCSPQGLVWWRGRLLLEDSSPASMKMAFHCTHVHPWRYFVFSLRSAFLSIRRYCKPPYY